MTRSWGRRGVAAYLLMLLTGGAALVGVQLTGGTVQAQLSTFRAIASAEGARQGTTAPGAPGADTFVDAASPLAQTLVSLGESTGLASAPYPGDLVVSGPGLIFGVLAGQGVPVGESPAYPFVAQSSYPTEPEANFEQGAINLAAKSSETESTSRASTGGDAQENAVSRTLATAVSRVDPVTHAVTAEGSAQADLIDVAGVLRIGRMTASAKVVRDAQGRLTRSSTLTLSEVTAAGQGAAITDKGIVVGGSGSPLPDTSPIAGILAQAGITARVVDGAETPDGIVSPALEISLAQNVGGRTVFQTYTFGRSVARVSSSVDPTVDPPVVDPGGTTPPPPPAAEPPIAAPPLVEPPVTPVDPGSAPAPQTPPQGPTVTPPNAPTAFGPAAFSQMDTASFYLILVVAGLVAVGGAHLVRVVGVRRTWTS